MLRLLELSLAGVMMLSSGWLSASPAVERLGSMQQTVRDEAAKELRKIDLKPDPDRWKPLMEQLRLGTSWSKCLVTLGSMTNKLQPVYAQMWYFIRECRLDDFHVLRLELSADSDLTPTSDYTLKEAKLSEDMRYVWVYPPKGFTGTWTTYFINGRKSHEFGYWDGKYYGTCTTYAPNGAVVVRHYYGENGLTGQAQISATNRSQPIRSETNPITSPAGSRR